MQIQKYKIKLDGIVPIMFNRFYVPPQGDTTKKKKLTLKDKLWIDEKGVYIPTDNLRMMLIGNKHRTGAAKIYGSTIESKKGKEYVDFAKACIWTVGLDDPMKAYFFPGRTTWDDTDLRSFINATGSRSSTERPLLKTPWSVEFEVHITDPVFDPDKVKAFYEVAGMRCGLGVYGPTFGRFVVAEWEKIAKRGEKS